LIANPSNQGFAAAVNQGFAVLDSPYILLLNPDAVLESGLEPLREACDLPGSAGAGGRLLDAGGRPQIGFMVRQLPTPATLALEVILLNRIWPGNPVNRRYRGLALDYSTRLAVEQPAGAFFMVRRAVWQELGGFDAGFFPLWFEDVDFCRRVADRGYHLYYAPDAVAKHTGAHSIRHLTLEMRRVYWYCSLLRYSAKHFRPGAFRMVCLAVVTGSLVRSIAESILDRSLRPLAAHGKVVGFAGRCLLFGPAPIFRVQG
jgi:GT2 family glycosyltransferase